MTQEQKKVGAKLEEHLKPEELKKQKRQLFQKLVKQKEKS